MRLDRFGGLFPHAFPHGAPGVCAYWRWWEIVCISLPRVEETNGARQTTVFYTPYTNPETGRVAQFGTHQDALAVCEKLNESLPEGVERYAITHTRVVVTLDDEPTGGEP